MALEVQGLIQQVVQLRQYDVPGPEPLRRQPEHDAPVFDHSTGASSTAANQQGLDTYIDTSFLQPTNIDGQHGLQRSDNPGHGRPHPALTLQTQLSSLKGAWGSSPGRFRSTLFQPATITTIDLSQAKTIRPTLKI